jgi:hypothetical protein
VSRATYYAIGRFFFVGGFLALLFASAIVGLKLDQDHGLVEALAVPFFLFAGGVFIHRRRDPMFPWWALIGFNVLAGLLILARGAAHHLGYLS